MTTPTRKPLVVESKQYDATEERALQFKARKVYKEWRTEVDRQEQQRTLAQWQEEE